MRDNEKTKLDSNSIKTNSYNRNIDTIKLIEKYDIAFKKIENITEEDVRQLFILLVKLDASQSDLDKVYDEIHQIAVVSRRYDLFDNIKRNTFISNVIAKDVIAFTIKEERQLLEYINTHEDCLVDENKSNLDNITIKNLIKLDFALGMRIGELCSLDKNNDIDKISKDIIVKTTITKDLERKSIVGTTTKTGRKKQAQGQKDSRSVPFRSFI